MSEPATCKKHISDGTFQGHSCGKTVVGIFNGEELCKRHLNVAKKRAEKRRKTDEDFEKSDAAKKQVEELAEELGVDVDPLYVPSFSRGGMGRYSSSQVVISIDELKRLAGK